MKNRFLPMLLAAALLLALCACTPNESVAPPVTPSASATPTPETTGTPLFIPPVFIPQLSEEVYTGDDPRLNTAFPGISVTFSLSMPLIENAAGNSAWEWMNEQFDGLRGEWLWKGLEYIGTPGLLPGGDYRIESSYWVARNDTIVSIRYQRTERLGVVPPAETVMTRTNDTTTGEPLLLDDFFRIADQENDRPLTRRLAEEVAALKVGPYEQETLESLLSYWDFYFTEETLVLCFPIWAGDATSPTSTLELPIPLDNLADIANERMPQRAAREFV